MPVMVSKTIRVKGLAVLAAALSLLACSNSHYQGGGRQNDLPMDQRNSTAAGGNAPSVDLSAGGDSSSGGANDGASGNEALGGSAGMGGNAGLGGSAGVGGGAGGSAAAGSGGTVG
jgi:hypothetical protein